MPHFRISKVHPDLDPEVAETISNMHAECFEGVPFKELHGDWWITYDASRKPVGFAGLWPSVRLDGAGYLVRGGVLPAGRGHGLQRRLIQTRIREARRKNWVVLFSDTRPGNAPSLNNLFACGFRMFTPTTPWASGGHEWNYVRRILKGVA